VLGGVLNGGDTGEAGTGNGHRPSYCFCIVVVFVGFGLRVSGGVGVWIGLVVRLVVVFKHPVGS
jgi:hypothetical protein